LRHSWINADDPFDVWDRLIYAAVTQIRTRERLIIYTDAEYRMRVRKLAGGQQ
jgi:hypothetical protein